MTSSNEYEITRNGKLLHIKVSFTIDLGGYHHFCLFAILIPVTFALSSVKHCLLRALSFVISFDFCRMMQLQVFNHLDCNSIFIMHECLIRDASTYDDDKNN